FAGALRTYTLEALMGDGKALQAGTSHNLGQHFAKVFNITFQDIDGERKFVWQTSWGVSTRLIGAIIMVHGDDSGLVLPPKIAPIQLVIIPIFGKKNEEEVVLTEVEKLKRMFPDIRMKIDDRKEYTPGWKFNEWELKGVPLRLEIGPKDVKKNQVVLVRRDKRTKEFVSVDIAPERVKELLNQIQKDLYEKALKFREERTSNVTQFNEFEETIATKKGFVKACWCGNPDCETTVKEKTMATIRFIPINNEGHNQCIVCGKEGELVYFARSY
ncbi:MAG: His/Gly/Thr/Pro-type tRNA ligase C-terminal domain-containing protein, partial [Candidatus Subteraquimicrobiales bacterium]|nr:His/Gly/Thr/Pro-type tRNA ligase C-terminal domain-containing protein [Candidatus Subteraquimicrobiales bacterium]